MKTLKTSEIKTIEINARRWFQRSYGNTYFSGDIIVNGKHAGSINFAYGYGDHCVDQLFKLAQDNGVIPETSDRLWRFCSDNNITKIVNIIDVPRKEDL